MSDQTRQFSPFDDDDDDDATRVQGKAPDDATVVTPRPDATSVMPPQQQDDWGRNAWAGRAEVRAPRPTRDDWATSAWDGEPPPPPGESNRKWWMPILLGIVGLILLAALGWGIYLIATSQEGAGTGPAPSAPATTAATKPPEATESTAATEPTSTPPTTTEATTEPADTEVTVPALVGLSRTEAQAALERRDLQYRVITRDGGNAPPETVIDSDPSEGQEVPAETVVTLVVAAQPDTPPASSPPA